MADTNNKPEKTVVRNRAAAWPFAQPWQMHQAACESSLTAHEGKAGSIKERLAAAPAWETQSPVCSLEANADM